MKTVFANHAEVCHIWAQQKQSEGRASRIFFRDTSIFSYGDHFEAARFVRPDLVFITTRRYSVSTAKHMGYIRNAVSHINHFTVPSFDDHNENVKYFLNKMEENGKLASKAIRRGEWLIGEMVRYSAELEKYLKLFGKSIPVDLRKRAVKEIKLIKAKNFDAILERSRAAVKVEREEAKAERLEREKKDAEQIEKWKNGENVGIHSQSTLLRVKADEIETSRGARVPLRLAVTMFKRLKSGHPVHGVTLGNYTVTGFDGSILTVGCHKIAMTEMERLYSTLPLEV